MPTNYQVQSGTLFEDFETLGDWTKGANGSIAIDSTYFRTGSGSLKLTSGSGSNCIADKTISQDFSSTGMHGVAVYIEDVAKVANLQIILSEDSGFTTYVSRSPSDANTGLFTGWNFILLPRGDWSATGSPDWANTKVRLRVRVDAVASQVAVVYYDSYYYGIYGRPKVIFTFDDGWETAITEGKRYMDKYKMKGVLYLNQDRENTTNYGTTAEFQECYDAGWDLSNHTSTHQDLATLTAAQVITEINDCEAWLSSRGWTRNNCHKHVAYPFGSYNSTVLSVMATQKILTARTTVSGGTVYQPVNKGLFNPYTLKTQSLLDTTTLAAAKVKMDLAIKSGGVIIFVLHKLVAVPAAQTEWPIADFQALVDYAFANRQVIDTVNLTDWYIGLSGGRKPNAFI